MDHNEFDFDKDFFDPLHEFFMQINLHVEHVKSIE